MGLFITGAAFILVIFQTSLLLLNRDATGWSFTLVKKTKSALVDKTLAKTIFQKTSESEEGRVQMLQALDQKTPDSSLSHCVLREWESKNPFPEFCFLWFHPVEIMDPVLTQWNPHLILQCITCVHCIVQLYSKPQATANSSRLYTAGALFLLWTVLAFIVGFGQNRTGLLEGSTWVSCLVLFLGCALFLYIQERREQQDLLWNLTFQLQMVGVPMTVLLLATMGIRSYVDIFILFVILSTAVNSLWLQLMLKGSALYLAKLLTISTPMICIYMTQGHFIGWEQVTAFMASISLAPLLIMPVILNHDDYGKGTEQYNEGNALTAGVALDRFQMRLGSLCSSAALLSSIINLAML